MNTSRRENSTLRCPDCGGYVTTTSSRNLSLAHPSPHIQLELGECETCKLRVQRKGDGPWRVDLAPLDDRLDEPTTSDIESRIRAKNGSDWVRFIDRMNSGDELWTLKPSFEDYVLIGIVKKGMVREFKRFKR